MGVMADSPQPPVDAAAPPGTEPAPETGSTPRPGSEPEDCVWLDLEPGHDGYGFTGLSDRLAALRAEAVDLLGRAAQAVVDHGAELAVGAGTAVLIGAGGWLVAAALTLAVWAMATPAAGSYAEPLHVAGQLWPA